MDYQLLHDALSHLFDIGYSEIGVPWVVQNPNAVKLIQKFNRDRFVMDGKHIISSSEEGFIERMFTKPTRQGKYCTVTPIFEGNSYGLQLGIFACGYTDAMFPHILDEMDQCYGFLGYHDVSMKINDDSTIFSFYYDDNVISNFGVREVPLDGYTLHWIFGDLITLPRFTSVMEGEVIDGVKV